jgi:hypothetical protein
MTTLLLGLSIILYAPFIRTEKMFLLAFLFEPVSEKKKNFPERNERRIESMS